MAITKTIDFLHADVYLAKDPDGEASMNIAHPYILIHEKVTIDDVSDNDLPVENKTHRFIYRFVEDNGDATDVSGENSLVQSIASAIWT